MSRDDVLLGLLLAAQATVEAAIEAVKGKPTSVPLPVEEVDEGGSCLHRVTREIGALGGAIVAVCAACGDVVP